MKNIHLILTFFLLGGKLVVGLDISLMQPRFSMKGKGLIASSDENRVFPLFAFASLPQAISFFFCQVHRFLQLFPTLLHITGGFCFQKHAIFPLHGTFLPSFPSCGFCLSYVLGCGFVSFPLLQTEASLLLHL